MNAKQHGDLMVKLESDPDYRNWFQRGRDVFNPEGSLTKAVNYPDNYPRVPAQEKKARAAFVDGWSTAEEMYMRGDYARHPARA